MTRWILVALFVGVMPAAAHAGPYDALALSAGGSDDGVPDVVALPGASDVLFADDAGKLKVDRAIAEADGSPYGRDMADPDKPFWGVQRMKVTLGGKSVTLVESGIDLNQGEGQIAMYAAQWALPMSDADAAKAAAAGTLAVPVLPAGHDQAPALSALIEKATDCKKLAKLAGADFTLAGSAADQLYGPILSGGGTDAAKVLAGWKLDLAYGKNVVSAAYDQGVGVVIATVTATPHGKKQAAPITYRVLFGLAKVKKRWKLALAHFALVQ